MNVMNSLAGDANDTYNSGGAGYTLNKAALKLLVVEGFPNHFQHDVIAWEDLMVGRTFRELGVFPYNTKDDLGGERYMHWTPGKHYKYRRFPRWYYRYHLGKLKYGLDHCAAKSVSFHYVKSDLQKRLHAMLYHLCPNTTIT